MNISLQRLKELFEYKDGFLVWKVRAANRIKIGDIAGGTNGKKQPYMRVMIDGNRYLVHRLIYAWHHGFMPEIVDHINGNVLDNRIENLRKATSSQNHQNSCLHKSNTSGVKNVSWNNRQNKWCVSVRVNKKKIHIGTFKDIEFADLVAHEARSLYFGQFARDN